MRNELLLRSLAIVLSPLWIPLWASELIGQRWCIWRLIRGDATSAWRRLTELWAKAGAVYGPCDPSGGWKIEFHVMEPFSRRHPGADHHIRESLLARDPYVAAYATMLLCGAIRMRGGAPVSADLPSELTRRSETIHVMLGGCECEELTLGEFALRQCWVKKADKAAASKC